MEEKQEQSKQSLSHLCMSKGQAILSGGALTASALADVVTHFDKNMVVLGGIAAVCIAARRNDILDAFAPGRESTQVAEMTGRVVEMAVPMPEEGRDQSKEAKLKRLLGLKSMPSLPSLSSIIPPRQSQNTQETASDRQEDVLPVESVQEPVSDARAAKTPATRDVARLPIEAIVGSTEQNSYNVCIGRSLTKDGNPPAQINFYKQHFKFIGASQKGKSSMVAAFLDIVTQTHDPDHVLIALLDLEDQTSRLFAHLDHVAEVETDKGRVLLHARDHEEVLEHLEYVVSAMNNRYELTKSQLMQEPILLVYIEEFLSLKNYFKQTDKQKYARLVFCINELARRGLKARVQLLLCAQVDYRDEDFQEALVNVSCGMAFCVRMTATQAAGFYNTELLRQNVQDNKVGQAVCEMPDCNDLILAPEYNLEKRLIALEEAEMEREGAQQRKASSILSPANSRKRASSAQSSQVFRSTSTALLEDPMEGAWEADGRYLEEKTDANQFELKRLLSDIGKMKANGLSHDAILKQYGLAPGGRNNQNLKAVTEVISALDSQAEEAD
jgi:hypothetical protein